MHLCRMTTRSILYSERAEMIRCIDIHEKKKKKHLLHKRERDKGGRKETLEGKKLRGKTAGPQKMTSPNKYALWKQHSPNLLPWECTPPHHTPDLRATTSFATPSFVNQIYISKSVRSNLSLLHDDLSCGVYYCICILKSGSNLYNRLFGTSEMVSEP